MVTRFCIETNCPIERLNLHVSSVSPLPKSYRDAFHDLNWQNAMRDEYDYLIKNKTWILVPRPVDTNIVCCIWLFRHKYLVDGTLSRYKARLVANGSTQLEGVDVDETFSSVVKPGSIRTVLSLAAFRHWPIHQLDVKNAFLHGDLSKTVYMHQPLGFRDSIHPDHMIAFLHQEFSMTDLGSLNYFLGISVTRDSSGLFLSQKKYAVEILERAHMVNSNPCRTPVDMESKLGVDGDPVSDPTLYRSLAGSLQYLTFTRLDISYTVQQLFSSSTTDLVAYLDADWACCLTTRRSTSGYCVFLGKNLLLWSSKCQPMLSHSSAEVEYRGVANVVAETCWLRNLLQDGDADVGGGGRPEDDGGRKRYEDEESRCSDKCRVCETPEEEIMKEEKLAVHREEKGMEFGDDQLRLRWMIYVVVLADAAESVRDVIGFEYCLASSSRWTKLRLPKELNSVHDTFHVSNLKKCLADANLHLSLNEIKIDKTLRFVEEPVEIMDCKVKSLKRSRIPLVKVFKSRDEISKRRGYCDNRDLSRVLLRVSPWKGVVHFRKKGKLAQRYVGPFEILERFGLVAYRLRLPEDLSSVLDTFHVWNSKRGPEFTWEHEDQMRIKYPQLFVDLVVEPVYDMILRRVTCGYPWPELEGKGFGKRDVHPTTSSNSGEDRILKRRKNNGEEHGDEVNNTDGIMSGAKDAKFQEANKDNVFIEGMDDGAKAESEKAKDVEAVEKEFEKLVEYQGIGEVGKKGWIKLIIRQEQPDIIEYKKLRDARSFTYKDGLGDERFMAVRVEWKGKDIDMHLACIYGPHVGRQKASLWNRISGLMDSLKGACCIFGDLNVVRGHDEKMNSQINIKETGYFNDFINELDRFLINEEFCNLWGNMSVAALDQKLLDHCPIVLKDVDLDFGSRPFRAFDVWLEEKDIGHVVEEAWKVENPSSIKAKMVRHYKTLFSEGSSIQPIFYSKRVEKISQEDALWMEKDFSEGEILDAIRGCGGDKALRPDDFNFKYIKKFWDILKSDLIIAIRWFGETMEISSGCNASFVTIIPKVTDPISLGDFRPISLIGCYYKIIAMVLAERIERVVGQVVGDVQNAFIKGIYILNGILIANEFMDHMRKTRCKGLIFIVDFEKAYDSLNWRFLSDIMKKMGFGNKWCSWIESCLLSSIMSILVNRSPTEEFCLERGVRQGDPLSPFLFILVAEGLNAIIKKRLIRGFFEV
ncbi:ribonuclease H-like domain-containing protein [Tanacetum coccineum]|uniref:Ribonuclease H-like domain-containing protein n=1 Tax=Tanacetum coccineum TaxID=301880 RepID=A0ABQ5CLI3_9ASTR